MNCSHDRVRRMRRAVDAACARSFPMAVAGVLLTASQAHDCHAQITFTDVTEDCGVTFVNHHTSPKTGVCAVDLTDDGYPELFFNNAGGHHNELYLNNRDGTFTEVGEEWGVRVPFDTENAVFADYDNDGRLDLILAVRASSEARALRVMRNTGTRFVDFPRYTGVYRLPPSSGQITAFHYDDDDFIDIFVGYCQSPVRRQQGLILRNNHRHGFNVMSPCRASTDACKAWQPVAADLNLDDRQDLFVAIDSVAPSRAYLQTPMGTLVDVGRDMRIGTNSDMGIAIADYDNDGDLDVYTTDIVDGNRGGNRLFQNQLFPSGEFWLTNVAPDAGVRGTAIGWGTTFLDYNNDGYLDLAVAYMNAPSELFRNRGDGTFDTVGAEVGFQPEGVAIGLAAVDYDLDGDEDLIVCNMGGPAQVYRNNGGSASPWIKIKLIDETGRESRCVGTKIWINTDHTTQFHQTQTGLSMVSQEPYLIHFGIGEGHTQCTIDVQWLDGTMLRDLPVNAGETITVEHN